MADFGMEIAFQTKETTYVKALLLGEGDSFKVLMADHGGRGAEIRGKRIMRQDALRRLGTLVIVALHYKTPGIH